MAHNPVLARVRYLQAELAALAALIELQDLEGATPAATPTPAPAPVVDDLPPEPEATEANVVAETPAKTPGRRAAKAKPAKRAKAAAKWSYLPSAAYALSGPNPFRNGNNFQLYDHLVDKFGSEAFSRVQLGAEIEALRSQGVITSSQPEQAIVISFVQFAGDKGRLQMAAVPADSPVDAPPEVTVPSEPEPAPAPPAKAPRKAKSTKTRKKAE